MTNGEVSFDGLSITINYNSLVVPLETQIKVTLWFTLCSNSGKCSTIVSNYAESQELNMTIPNQLNDLEDPFLRIDVQPRSTIMGNYSLSFQPQIAVIDSQGQMDTLNRYTIFMTLVPGHFLGGLVTNAKLEKAFNPNVFLVGNLRAKVDTIDARTSFDRLVVTGRLGDDFSVVFTRCYLGSNLIESDTGDKGEIFFVHTPRGWRWTSNSTGSRNKCTSDKFSILNTQLFFNGNS